MKRYSLQFLDQAPDLYEHPQGDYVRYEDVKDFIEEAYHEYEPRPDGKRCRVCKEKEEHAMHHWQSEPPENPNA